MRKIAAVGASLLVGGAVLAGGATPAQASDLCSNPTFSSTCELIQRNAQHVREELGHVPGYVDEAKGHVLAVYDLVTGTVRCLIDGSCPPL